MSEVSNAHLKRPPGRKGHRISNLRKRIRDTVGLFEELQEEYGDIASYQLPFLNCCAVYDADLIREILVSKQSSFSKGPIGRRVMRATNLVTVDSGAEHRRRRKLAQPSFNRKSSEVFFRVVVEQAAAQRDNWHSGQVIDVREEVKRFAINVATAVFFGEGGRITIDPEIVRKAGEALTRRMQLAFFPFHKLLWNAPTPGNVRAKRALEVLDKIISEIVHKARHSTEERTDIVSLLARAKDEEGIERSYTDEEVHEEAIVMLFAGHETCASLLMWCVSYILQQPEIIHRLEAEIDEVVGDRTLTFGDYDKLRYASALINETLRLVPPTHYVGRTAKEDLFIGDYFIAKGTLVQPVIRRLHRSEKHFARADAFIPERWLDAPRAERPEHAYIPFGSGARICIGWKFALIETTIYLASLVQRWRLEPASGRHTVPERAASLEIYRYPESLPVVLRERNR